MSYLNLLQMFYQGVFCMKTAGNVKNTDTKIQAETKSRASLVVYLVHYKKIINLIHDENKCKEHPYQISEHRRF